MNSSFKSSFRESASKSKTCSICLPKCNNNNITQSSESVRQDGVKGKSKEAKFKKTQYSIPSSPSTMATHSCRSLNMARQSSKSRGHSTLTVREENLSNCSCMLDGTMKLRRLLTHQFLTIYHLISALMKQNIF